MRPNLQAQNNQKVMSQSRHHCIVTQHSTLQTWPLNDELHRRWAGRAGELRPDYGHGCRWPNPRPRQPGETAVRLRRAACKRRGGCREVRLLCAPQPPKKRCNGGVICTEHGLVLPQRRRIGPSTPPDPDAIDDC